MTQNVAVLGSINMDLVTEMDRLPRLGETVQGRSFSRYPGGKGANQAVAAALMGADVALFGKVGHDLFGEELLQSLRENGIHVKAVKQEEKASSGITTIWVDGEGANAIAYIPGANAWVDTDYVDQVLPTLAGATVLLLQFETPLETIDYLLKRLPEGHPLVVLDPAPAQDISGVSLGRVDIITPNHGELTSLANTNEIEKAAHRLLSLGIGQVVCTVGEEGVYLVESDNFRHFPAYCIDPVDTTAAGDAFTGALAVALARGRSTEEAIQWANAAGALATTRKGAQPSLPSRHRVESFLKRAVHTDMNPQCQERKAR